MNYQTKRRYLSIVSMFLSVIMMLGVMSFNVLADETVAQGLWTITNGQSSGEATYGDIGFTYYSPTTIIDYGASGGKDYAASKNSSGKESEGIVGTNGSYASFPAKADGTLTVYVGNKSDKTGYVSKTDADGKSTAIASYVPGGSGNYDAEGFKVTQGTTWTTLEIEVEKGTTYYINVQGSKMRCYGAEFVPYRQVAGSIIDSTDSFPSGSYQIKFTEKTSGKATTVDVSNDSYSVYLKPAEYSVSLAGSLATSYSFTSGSRNISVSAGDEILAADLTVEESISYTVSGDILGLPDDYSTKDLKLVFEPEDTASFISVIADINGQDTEEVPDVAAEPVGTNAINFVAGVDSLDYEEAGFFFEANSKTVQRGTNVVYTSIADSSVSAEDLEKTYVYAFTINDIASADTEITVTPYVITLDGETVRSSSKTFSLNSLSKNTSADEDVDGLTYSALLAANEKYTLKVYGAADYELAKEITVINETANSVVKDIELVPVETYSVSGSFLGLTGVRGEYEKLDVTPDDITFTNIDDGYVYTGTAEAGTYTAKLREGSYIAAMKSDSYSTSTHVVVDGKAVTRDLLLKDISNKTIAYSDTIYVGSDKEYKTVQSAVDAVKNMTRTEGQRVTIKIDPGTYREQVVVDTPNVTFEGNGGTREDTKITWYYGIGYKYYSCVNSCYDPYADYDKFEKGDAVSYWGAAVITKDTATGFKAQNITFENSFNKYMTEEEMADGVEINGRESINVVRKENTNVDTRTATERAAALVNYADEIEFNNCSFIGSQDTLYTTNKNDHKSYYKNCYIEGQTDFIYGNGDVIFDGCEINFCGYDGTESAGYITANSNSQTYYTQYGYIFRSCYVSYNSERDTTAGYMGRMWNDSTKVAFINTQLQESDMIIEDGWSAMSGNQPTGANMTLVEYNTTHNGEKVDTSKRVAGVKDSINADDYSVEKVFMANGWTPVYYTADSSTVPSLAEDPAMVSNGDLNAPNPGETITLIYAINEELANNDASIISWYAVDTDYDPSSLETILKSAKLLKAVSAVSTNKFQIPMECKDKYIMAVITPVTINGLTGAAKYVIDTQRPVSNTWSDPDNAGSIAPGSGINIYLAGDSTVKDYSAEGIYNGGSILKEGSWGEFLQCFFDKKYVTVNNYAQGGRAVRSFLNEGKLDSILKNIKEGDYLFMQFGHNDCANGKDYYLDRFVPLYTADTKCEEKFPTIIPTEDMKTDKPSSLTNISDSKYYAWDCGATYKGYLQYYINAALEKGAIPVIVSPVARLSYNSDGTIRTHHDATMTDYEPTIGYNTSNDAYVRACEELYEENIEAGNNVLYLDGFHLTKSLYEEAYKNNSSNGAAVFAKGDATHNNKTGGIIQAGVFAKWIQDAGISISSYVMQPETAFGENPDGEYIFTIRNSVFTAKDSSYNESSYWTMLGQEIFDSLSGAVAKVTLNFASDEALDTYVTNADSTYTDGKYSGTYTNDSGEKFKATVYQDAVQYYENDKQYGTKALSKSLFSFETKGAGVYTVTATSSTGEGTANLYSDKELTAAVAEEASIPNGSSGIIVYTKTTDDEETLYFAADASNMYISNITVTKEELPEEKPNEILLNFATDKAFALYVTDAESTFIDDEYSGVYTNADGKEYEVTILKDGIQYYGSNVGYGTMASPNKPIFSFVADEAATYTFTAAASTGSGTIGLYKDAACSQAVAEAASTEELVYKKTSSDAEVLYFATPDAGNMYLKEVTISSYVPLAITLDFNTDDALKMYVTNADSTYVGGVASGIYTNANGQSFDVSIYKDGIQYYNNDTRYGTKASLKVPVFSFVADERAMYTLNFTTGTGGATINLYSDAECTKSIVSASESDPLVYKKKSSEPETIYVATSAVTNYYMATASIKKGDLPEEEKVKFTGNISGIEADDTNIVITLKGQTENLTVDADKYKSEGIELIVGETYVISAKGDKGVYLGDDIVTDDSGIADLVFGRIYFDFPLDFIDNYYDYDTYFKAMGYGSSAVTDPYSGITVHPSGVVMTESYYQQYGVKTNSNDIISFTAKQTGTVKVTVNVGGSDSDTLVLKVNGEQVGDPKNASGDVELTADVKASDTVTIHTPTRKNLWYKAIDVEYAEAEAVSAYEEDNAASTGKAVTKAAISDEEESDVQISGSEEENTEFADEIEVQTSESDEEENTGSVEENNALTSESEENTEFADESENITDGGNE